MGFEYKWSENDLGRGKIDKWTVFGETQNEQINAWWFCNEDHRPWPEYGHVASVGKAYESDPDKLALKVSGFHGSASILNALQHDRGTHVFYSCMGGRILHGKWCMSASEITYLAGGVDISGVLHAFARQCARDVLHLWDAPQVVADYLNSETEELSEDAIQATLPFVGPMVEDGFSPDSPENYAAASAYAVAYLVEDENHARSAWYAVSNAIHAKTPPTKESWKLVVSGWTEYNQKLEDLVKAKLGIV